MQLPYVSEAVNWLEEHAALSTAIVIGSLLFVVASLWVVHRFLTTIPPTYFQQKHNRLEHLDGRHPVLRWAMLVGKNVLGAVLILLGIPMLIGPGQGILSILMGLALVDVPGKRAVERKIIQYPGVLKVINRLRERAGQPPLEF